MKLGQDGRGSSQQQKIAEGIAQKEIDMGLRKDGPEPSAEEKGLAEGIAKKEIAIDTGDDVPTQSWFGRKKAKPSTEPQISKVYSAHSEVLLVISGHTDTAVRTEPDEKTMVQCW